MCKQEEIMSQERYITVEQMEEATAALLENGK